MLNEIFINKISPNFGIYEIFPYDYGNASWRVFRKNEEIFWKDGILYGKFSEVTVKIYTSNILIGGGKNHAYKIERSFRSASAQRLPLRYSANKIKKERWKC